MPKGQIVLLRLLSDTLNPHHAGACTQASVSPPTPYHSPFAAQLQQFISVTGPALRSVTTLEITAFYANVEQEHLIGGDVSNSGPDHSISYLASNRTELSQAASSELASLLVAACPNVCHLGATGGLSESGLRVLGCGWSKLTSLEILDTLFGVGHSCWTSNPSLLLPHLTRLRGVLERSNPRQVDKVRHLFSCPSLTHLELGKGWFLKQDDWLLLPPQLQSLISNCLPLNPRFSFPTALRLGQLRSIHLTDEYDTRVGIVVLAALLRLLQLSRERTQNSIRIDGSTSWVIEDLCFLHQCVAAGLDVKGLSLDCSRSQRPLNAAGAVPSIAQALAQMPLSLTFQSVSLDSGSRDHGGGSGSVSAIASAFPELERLGVSGSWDVDLAAHAVFRQLWSLDVGEARLTAAAVLQLVTHMPVLQQLSVAPSHVQGRPQEVSQAKLRITQVLSARETVKTLGNWSPMEDLKYCTRWSRG